MIISEFKKSTASTSVKPKKDSRNPHIIGHAFPDIVDDDGSPSKLAVELWLDDTIDGITLKVYVINDTESKKFPGIALGRLYEMPMPLPSGSAIINRILRHVDIALKEFNAKLDTTTWMKEWFLYGPEENEVAVNVSPKDILEWWHKERGYAKP